MKKHILFTALAIALATVAARADSAAGYFTYKYADWAESGGGLGAMYTWDLDMDIRVDARLSFVHFGDPDLDMIPLEATAAYQWHDRDYEPYVGLGVGWYLLEADRGDADGDIGFQLFAGLEADVGLAWDLFAEINWLILESDVDGRFREVEQTGSKIELDGIGINLGFMHRF